MANIRRMTKKRLGELLLQEGMIKEEQLEECLTEQKQTGELIGEILVRKGYVNESDIAKTISVQFSFPYLTVTNYYIGPEMLSIFTLETLEKHCFVPIDRFGDVLGVVIAGLLDQDVIDDIEKQTGCTIQVYVGKVSEVKQVIKEKFAGVTSGAKTAAAAATDVTAPPKLKPIAKKKLVDGEDVGDDEPDIAGKGLQEAGKSGSKSDKAVVEELEQQFKKFRFFEDDAKGTAKGNKGSSDTGPA